MSTLRLTALTLLGLSAALGCSKADDSAGGETAGKATPQVAKADNEKIPTLTINEAQWVEKDLHEVAPMIHVTLKAPKDATFEKNGNGGVDITFAKFYMVTVGNLAVGSMQSALEWGEASSIGSSSYQAATKIQTDDTGFVFSYQMKDEENGTTYGQESHFYHFLEKEGAIYSMNDSAPLGMRFSTPAAAFSPELAKQVYGLIKKSAKAN